MGEKGLHLAVELGCEGLVVHQHQGWPLHRLDHIGNSEGLAGAGHPEQRHPRLTVIEPLYQATNRLRLVPCRRKVRLKLKFFHHWVFCCLTELAIITGRDHRYT